MDGWFARLRIRLASLSVPQRVVIHDELPRIGSGKIDRRTLAGASDG